jgi:hypothetical protein
LRPSARRQHEIQAGTHRYRGGRGSAQLGYGLRVRPDGRRQRSDHERQRWTSTPVTDVPTDPNYEQFGGRLVPFFGDYIMVGAVGSTVAAAWTDSSNVVGAGDPTGNNDNNDVAGDPETGGTCASSFTTCFDGTGGLDQNIYTANIHQ